MIQIFRSDTGMYGLRWFENEELITKVLLRNRAKFVGTHLDYIDNSVTDQSTKVKILALDWDAYTETFMFTAKCVNLPGSVVIKRPFTEFRLRNGKNLKIEVEI